MEEPVNGPRNLVFALMFVIFAAGFSTATTRYVAQAAGTFSGGAACNGQTAITPATWNSTSESAGDITYLCGTLTGGAGQTLLTIGWSGSSGNPIQIIFDTGASLQAPYWGGNPFNGDNAAIVCNNGRSWITIDGGTNGLVENTANGSALADQQASAGIVIDGCSSVEIKNLQVGPIYTHTQDDGGGQNTVGIYANNANALKIDNNKIHDAYQTINAGYGGASLVTSTTIFSNTIDHACHFIQIGDANTNSIASGYVIHDNTMGPHQTEWAESGGGCHSDGIVISAFNSGSVLSNTTIYNNVIQSDMCNATTPDPNFNCTAWIFMTGDFSGANIFNNVLVATVATYSGYESLLRIAPNSYSGATQTNFNILNNTFVGNNSTQSCDCAAIKSDGNESGFLSQNNIFIHISPNTTYLNEASTLATVYSGGIDRNDYYDVSKIGDDFANSQNYYWANPVLWRQPNSTNSFPGYDQNGSNSNPSLGSGYIPQSGSAAIGLGANLTSLCSGSLAPLCTDAAGNARPSTGNWDAGAYQFVSAEPAPALGMFAWDWDPLEGIAP